MIAIADLLDWLGNPTEPGVSDMLTALEARAVDIIQNETERYFGASTSLVEYLDGRGTPTLRLKERPSSLTTVEERQYPGDDWTTITAGAEDGYELRLPSSNTSGAILTRKNFYLWKSGFEYRFTYGFGYVPGAEPPEIRQAVLDLVALKYRERGREGLRGETMGDYSYSIMATAVGRRDIYSVPGLAEIIRRWRGMVYA